MPIRAAVEALVQNAVAAAIVPEQFQKRATVSCEGENPLTQRAMLEAFLRAALRGTRPDER